MHLKVVQENANEIKSETPCDGAHAVICDLCNHDSEGDTEFKMHMESVHEQKSDKPYSCTLCDYRTKSIQQYTR